MTEEDAEEILAAADQGFRAAGHGDFDQAAREGYRFLERVLQCASGLKTRDSAKSALLNMEMPPEDVQRLISFLPNMAYIIRDLLPGVAKNIPHDPGGRPNALTTQQKEQVCAEVATLYGRGILVGNAIKRVANKFGVSERTVRRTWGKRSVLYKSDQFPNS